MILKFNSHHTNFGKKKGNNGNSLIFIFSVFLLFIMITCIMLSSVQATVINVGSGDFGDIQASLNSATSGDVINLGTNNYATGSSGISNGIDVKCSNITIQGSSPSNKATLDGEGANRLFLVNETDITFKNILFKNGKYHNNTGGAIKAAQKITIINCTFQSNVGDSGGAVMLHDDATGSKIIDCIFTNNNCGLVGDNDFAEGGALTIRASNVEVINCNFPGNSAPVRAGALAISTDALNTVIKNCNFQNNYAPRGGAIYIITSNSQIINCNFKNNKATDGNGGAIYALATFTSSQNVFEKNTGINGGAIYSNSTFNISNSNFKENNGTNGGAIFTTATLILRNLNFTNNKATSNGGAIYSTNALTISNSNFNTNAASNGGVIYSINTLSVSNSNLNNNKATNGGAIYSSNTLTVSNSNFNSNSASNGGAIYSKSTATISGSSKFTSNSANYGSGIYSSSVLNLASTVSFVNNLAPSNIAISLPNGITYNYASITVDNVKYTPTEVKIVLTKNDNYKDAVWSTNIVNLNGKKQTLSKYLSGRTVTLNNQYSGKTDSNGVALIKYIVNSLTSFNGLDKQSSKESFSFSAKFAGDKLYKASSASISVKAYVSSRDINSYWNLKTTKVTTVKKYNKYKVTNTGWYKWNGKKWAKISKAPTSSGTWYIRKNSRWIGYNAKSSSIFKKSKYTKIVKFRKLISSTTTKTKELNPYVNVNLTVSTSVNGGKYTKKSFNKIYVKSTEEIYYLTNEYSKKLSDKINSKDGRINVNNTIMRNVVKSICKKINGQITGQKKYQAIFYWQATHISYQGYKNSHFNATDVYWRMNKWSSKHANCVDQSILLVSLLRTAGVPSYFINAPKGSCYAKYGHVYVKVYKNNKEQEILDTVARDSPGKPSWGGRSGAGSPIVKEILYFYKCSKSNHNHHNLNNS